jgi:biotin carboxylase
VITTGNRPADLGHNVADRYIAADFSNREQILDVAASAGISAIVSGCNDFAALSTAYVAEQLGLGGHDPYDVAVRLHHKDRFRELLEVLEIPTPASAVVHGAQEAQAACDRLGFPLIVKPVDMTGGKGIHVCTDVESSAAAIADALSISRQSYVVLEQFMIGSRHGFTCFTKDSKVEFWFADDEQYYLNPFLVSGTSTPSTMPRGAIDELIAAVELISSHLRLADGLMHLQCILTSSGPRIVELCRRCPGDLYPYFVEMSTGFDYALAVVSAELGREVPTADLGTDVEFVSRHCLMADRSGVVHAVTIEPELSRRVRRELMWWTPGQAVGNHLTEKLGILFFSFEGAQEMHASTAELTKRINVDVS